MTPLLAIVDPWILAFSAITVLATIFMGFWSARKSKTAHDFFVAGRSVSVGWNASAISGEYLSAASFMGVAGMVMSSGYDALWYPVCYACGYLFLLLFIAGPLRRFGAYTIPDFAEGRFDSPLFRKIAVVFVLFIGFFYTMPQMKGAGTTLAYIFPGLPYWVGVVLVGAVITLNVALGGMKGITLVQAVQYWAKMFAISVPVFVLMAVYGSYGTNLYRQELPQVEPEIRAHVEMVSLGGCVAVNGFILKERNQIGFAPDASYQFEYALGSTQPRQIAKWVDFVLPGEYFLSLSLQGAVSYYSKAMEEPIWLHTNLDLSSNLGPFRVLKSDRRSDAEKLEDFLRKSGLEVERHPTFGLRLKPANGSPSQEPLVASTSGTARQSSVSAPRKQLPEKAPHDFNWLSPFGPLTTKAAKAAHLSAEESKPYSLLYTYSLIIALVCGTAGLPHILVRFYTNPDGVAAKRTTMWVMILIGVFYVFPPVFGVIGRNLLPDLYSGVGAKGTDKIVLELPRILNEKYGVLGSILSGITCAGAFAAFMSTFSGLLVSMTGALAHDVYGRMLRPKSTPDERTRMFKVFAVVCGAGAMLLGFLVEGFEINKMVGWAFAIAAASYFPLLFMSTWWRGMTMKGAATGMLTGGTLSLLTVVSTMLADQVPWAKPLAEFYATHPLLRILCEQPAIWAVPLALGLMIVVSKLTAGEIPTDIRMKMLVLHAPEKLGLKQEYIQEHQHGH